MQNFNIRLFRWLLIIVLIALVITLPRKLLSLRYTGKIYSTDGAPQADYALVFGAGLRRDGTPTAVLNDRVRAAVDLYLKGKIKKLLLSGSGVFQGYDEPGAMNELALSLGVDQNDIVIDRGGNRTFDSCLRAQHLIGDAPVLLVTQNFHLPRAMAICDALGLRSYGVSADLREFSSRTMRIWEFRETLATLVAIWDITFNSPDPLALNPWIQDQHFRRSHEA
jgi:SanA protein